MHSPQVEAGWKKGGSYGTGTSGECGLTVSTFFAAATSSTMSQNVSGGWGSLLQKGERQDQTPPGGKLNGESYRTGSAAGANSSMSALPEVLEGRWDARREPATGAEAATKWLR